VVSRAGISGVFWDETVDQRAFFDRLVLSIWGDRKIPKKSLIEGDIPIGGKKRAYARQQNGSLATGNPYQLKHGLTKAMAFMPSMMLTLRSEASPLTAIETIGAVGLLCDNVTRVLVSEAELTFDLSDTSVDYFRQRITSLARIFKQLRDEQGRETIYVRSRTSPWELKVYQKMPEMARCEYTLRREYLRKVGIVTPLDLGRVRDLDLTALSSLRELDESVFNELVAGLDDLRRRVLQSHRRNLVFTEFLRAARDILIIPESALLKPPLVKRLEKMQKGLLFDDFFPATPL
jgi:hypothetical protein